MAKVAVTAALSLTALAGLAAGTGILTAGVTPPPVAAPTVMVLQNAPSPLTKVVRANFAKWDTNHDGVLTSDEITRAVDDLSNQGDAGAAAATLHNAELNHDSSLRFTSQSLSQTEQDYKTGQERDLDEQFQTYQWAIRAQQNTPLFVHATPQMDDVRQGDLGDCYLDSVIGRFAALHPQAVEQMIATHPDGSYTVTFPGRSEPVPVPALTDAEKAEYGNQGPKGEWQLVIEKAAGSIRPLQWFGNDNKTPFDKLDSAWLAEWSIKLLTGSGSNVYFTQSNGLHNVPLFYDGWTRILTGASVSAHSDEGNVAAIRAVLVQAEADHKLVVASTGPSQPKFNLPASHYEGLIQYDQATDKVTMWNQWGYEPGDPHVQPQQGGVFTMSLADFCQGFEKVTVQQ